MLGDLRCRRSVTRPLQAGAVRRARARTAAIVLRTVDLGLRQMRFRHDPGYRATMSGDDNRLPALDVIKKLGKVNFGLRGLNFAHEIPLV